MLDLQKEKKIVSVSYCFGGAATFSIMTLGITNLVITVGVMCVILSV
jgi:hypothetical protein